MTIADATGKERDAETGLDYFGARYMSSAQGRFTTADPLGAGAGREADPQSWNLYAYGRNNPLKYVDPLGLTYQVCDTSGHCSNLDDATFESERNSGGKNGEYFSRGKLFHFDSGGNKISDGSFAHTDIDSSNGPALVGELGRRADAQIQFIGAFAAASVVAGTGVGAGLQVAGGSSLTTLESASPYFRYASGQLNQIIGDTQRVLLRDLLGDNIGGATSRLENFRIPEGLTRRSLEIYKDLAERVIQRGPGAPGLELQKLRLEIVDKALQSLK